MLGVATNFALTVGDFKWVHTDANASGTQTPAFLTINPIGKIPTLVLDDGTVLAESNAILLHLGEQYSHEPVIAVARNVITWQLKEEAFAERLPECARQGAHALDVMERRLADQVRLAGTGAHGRRLGPVRLHPPGQQGRIRHVPLARRAGLGRPRFGAVGGRTPSAAECSRNALMPPQRVIGLIGGMS